MNTFTQFVKKAYNKEVKELVEFVADELSNYFFENSLPQPSDKALFTSAKALVTTFITNTLTEPEKLENEDYLIQLAAVLVNNHFTP